MRTIGKHVRVTGERRAKLAPVIIRKYVAGYSVRSIADECGRSYGFVHSVLKENGIKFRSRGGDVRRQPVYQTVL